MEKKTLTFKTDKQDLVKIGGIDEVASGTINYINAQFTLGEEWTRFESVSAVWQTEDDMETTVLDSEGKCNVPDRLLADVGEVKVNLFGSVTQDDIVIGRLTSYPILAIKVTAKASTDSSLEES